MARMVASGSRRTRHGWITAALLAGGIAGCSMLVSAAAGKSADPRTLAEQIHNHLLDRYQVEKYSFEQSGGGFLFVFTLTDGSVLTYDHQGHIVRRLHPDGSETHFANGYPAKTLSPQGQLLSSTEYSWTPAGRVKSSVTTKGETTIANFFDDQGDVFYETVHTPEGLFFRYGYSWSDDRRFYNYFETRSKDGITDYFSVALDTGLLREQWRVTGGLARRWDAMYEVFMDLLLDRIRGDYTDRSQLKKDSQGRTRGDVLLALLQPQAVYPPERFTEDVEKKRIVFDQEWRHIDCTDAVVTLPAVELHAEEYVLSQKAKVKNDKVYVWVSARKSWEPYPFDARKETLIPSNMLGDARVESRYRQTKWQQLPDQTVETTLTLRLVIPPAVLARQKGRISQRVHDDTDFDDLHQAMARADDPGRPAAAPIAPAGERITQLNEREIRILQLEVTYQVKNELQVSPHLNQRDSSQLTQAELIIRAVQPEHLLARQDLLAQLDRLRRQRRAFFDQITYSNLEVFLPQIAKRKMYRVINRVREVKGVIRVWKEDVEHPEGGYWAPYALRPGRDELYASPQGRLQIKVDEGSFQWEITPEWKSRRVSGEVYLALAKPGQAQKPAPMPAGRTKKSSRAADRAPAAARVHPRTFNWQLAGALFCGQALPNSRQASGMLLRLVLQTAQVLRRGLSGRQLLQESTDSKNRIIRVWSMLDWQGRVRGYQRTYEKEGRRLMQEEYGKDKRLQRMQDEYGFTYEAVYEPGDKVLLTRRRAGGRQGFHFQNSRLQAVSLADNTRLEYESAGSGRIVRLLDAGGQRVYDKAYDSQGRQSEMRFAHGEKITYQYGLPGKKTRLDVCNAEGQQAQIVINAQGRILKQEGNGKLIHFSLQQLDFIRPGHYEPFEVDFYLK
ncbi:hypothetical protein JW933_00950 [candidate division FCPU426 bacterium]|nr:hypothetical protein [candidate division FCPU426 bacterium]